MKTIIIDVEIVIRITRDLTLYQAAPFLKPIEAPALSIAKKFDNVSCKGCARRAMLKAAGPLAAAFTRLLVTEAKKTPNGLPQLRQAMAKILNTSVDEVRVNYKDEKGAVQELKF